MVHGILLNFLLFTSLYIVHLKERFPPLSTANWREIYKTREALIDSFRFFTKDLKGFQIKKEFHVFPGLLVDASEDVIDSLKKIRIVSKVVEDFKVELFSLEEGVNVTSLWHLDSIELYPALDEGYSGNGILIGFIDSGYDPNHLEIKDKAHPQFGFYDAVQYRRTPYDDVGHGTYVVSLAVGDSVGVARGAQFSMARAFKGGEGYASDIHEAFEWFFSLFDSGAPPRIINGSFGITGEPDNTEFFDDILTLEACGVIPVFAIGNDGPYGASSEPPGNYPISLGVGAVDSTLSVTYFSSRGPAPFTGLYADTTYWPLPDWNFLKPDIVSPGYHVLGAWPGGIYKSLSGTSVSAPLVAGAVAILLEKNHSLTFREVYEALAVGAKKPDIRPYPNMAYGFGVLNIKNSLDFIGEDSLPHLYIAAFNFTPPIIQTGSYSLHVKLVNDGGEADSVYCYLTADEAFIHLDGDTVLYYLGEGDTVDLSFEVFFDETTPYGIPFILRLHLQFGMEVTLPIHYHTGLTGDKYLDVWGDSLSLTVTSLGSLGFLTSEGRGGSGFHFPSDAPNSLYMGTFALGNSPEYVVDHYYESNSMDDFDWMPLSSFYPMGDSGVYVLFNDNYHENPKDIMVKFSIFKKPSFFVLQYNIKNSGNETVDSLYASLILDWDVEEAERNRAMVDDVRRAAIMWRDSLYYASSLVEPADLVSNISVIDNPSFVYPYAGFPDELEFIFMKGYIRISRGDAERDYSTIVAVGPFSLVPGDSEIVVFAMVGGWSRYNVIRKLEEAERWYRSMMGHYPPLSAGKGNYLALRTGNILIGERKLEIDYSFEKEEGVDIVLYSVSGRVVKKKRYYIKGRGSLVFEFPKIGSGIYFLKAGSYRRKLIYLR